MKYYEDLIKNNHFSEQEAKEIADIIIKTENIDDIYSYDFSHNFDLFGAGWCEDELEEYYNMDLDEKVSIEEILKLDYVHVLSSGLIITWKYW